MEVFGVHLLGTGATMGHKLLLTLAVVAGVLALRALAGLVVRRAASSVGHER